MVRVYHHASIPTRLHRLKISEESEKMKENDRGGNTWACSRM